MMQRAMPSHQNIFYVFVHINYIYFTFWLFVSRYFWHLCLVYGVSRGEVAPSKSFCQKQMQRAMPWHQPAQHPFLFYVFVDKNYMCFFLKPKNCIGQNLWERTGLHLWRAFAKRWCKEQCHGTSKLSTQIYITYLSTKNNIFAFLPLLWLKPMAEPLGLCLFTTRNGIGQNLWEISETNGDDLHLLSHIKWLNCRNQYFFIFPTMFCFTISIF